MEYVNALKYDIDRMFKTSDMKIQDIKNIGSIINVGVIK